MFRRCSSYMQFGICTLFRAHRYLINCKLENTAHKLSGYFSNSITVDLSVFEMCRRMLSSKLNENSLVFLTCSQNIEKWINESSEGVIYFSLGSMIKGHTFPEDKKQAFLKAFGRLSSYRVLWKWENETMANKPDNVMTQKWMPQFDILCKPYSYSPNRTFIPIQFRFFPFEPGTFVCAARFFPIQLPKST